MVIIRICDRPEVLGQAAKWFHEKWGIPEETYRESMEMSLCAPVPCWYLCMDGETIAGGMGVIENDFHPRTDLAPNVCAVYTEPAYRGRGIAGELLSYVAMDMAGKGIDTLYLVTNHINLYERYGWSYLCPVETEDGMNRIYTHKEQL